MSNITNDDQFRQAITGLDETAQRVLAARFVDHVLALGTDKRIDGAVSVAARPDASGDELGTALKTAKSATVDSHTRCGAEGDWKEQAGYFVCRAAVAALTPAAKTQHSPAWQAAMSSRMARTSLMIDEDTGEAPTHSESEWQYQALAEYLEP